MSAGGPSPRHPSPAPLTGLPRRPGARRWQSERSCQPGSRGPQSAQCSQPSGWTGGVGEGGGGTGTPARHRWCRLRQQAPKILQGPGGGTRAGPPHRKEVPFWLGIWGRGHGESGTSAGTKPRPRPCPLPCASGQVTSPVPLAAPPFWSPKRPAIADGLENVPCRSTAHQRRQARHKAVHSVWCNPALGTQV